MDGVMSDLGSAAFIVAFVIGIGLLVAGASHKLVIYYDGSDMGITTLGAACLFFVPGLWQDGMFETSFFNFLQQWLVVPFVGVVGLICVWVSFRDAIRHNRNLPLGLFVGVFKLCFVVLGVFVAGWQILKWFNQESTWKDLTFSLIAMSILMKISRAMINGEAVYRAKGWELPVVTAGGTPA